MPKVDIGDLCTTCGRDTSWSISVNIECDECKDDTDDSDICNTCYRYICADPDCETGCCQPDLNNGICTQREVANE